LRCEVLAPNKLAGRPNLDPVQPSRRRSVGLLGEAAPPVFDPSFPAVQELRVVAVGNYPLPAWGGSLRVLPSARFGVPLAWLGRLQLRSRVGAERFQSGLGRPPRSLKKQYQEAGIPAWQRVGPLIFSGGQLVFVPGLGLDARVLGLPGQDLVELRWEAGPPGERR
jgi:tRNA(Ile)-lysidine synthase